MIQRILSVTALALCAAGPAAAQFEAHFDIGFATKSDTFDKDGERQDFKDIGGTEDFHIPIVIGGTYDVFKGLFVGLDFSLLRKTTTDAADDEKGTFGIRELELQAGWRGGLAIVDLDVHLGFKVDLGKKPDDVGESGVATSDNQHAVRVGLKAMFGGLPFLRIGPRVDAVFHLEREIETTTAGKTVTTERKDGVLVDSALVLAGRVGFDKFALLFGLDIGFVYQAESEAAQDADENDDVDTTNHLLYLTPYLGASFGPHKVLVSLALQDEDAMIGIPLLGKDVKVTSVPVTIGYQYSM